MKFKEGQSVIYRLVSKTAYEGKPATYRDIKAKYVREFTDKMSVIEVRDRFGPQTIRVITEKLLEAKDEV